MKHIYTLFLLLFILASCGTKEEVGVIEEVGQTADSYIKTLETSVNDARSVTESLNQRQADLQKSLDLK